LVIHYKVKMPAGGVKRTVIRVAKTVETDISGFRCIALPLCHFDGFSGTRQDHCVQMGNRRMLDARHLDIR
jgi:hypothetical protein